jgi:hypothetical protein
MSDDETWEYNELGEAEVTRTCEGCGESHTVRLLDPSDQAVLLYLRKDGRGRVIASLPPHMAIATTIAFLEEFGQAKGITVKDAIRRAKIEAAHGPFGMPSEN